MNAPVLLPEWPKTGGPASWGPLHFEQRRRAYWESRCRLAVAQLTDVASGEIGINLCIKHAQKTLDAIGPLPPEGAML